MGFVLSYFVRFCTNYNRLFPSSNQLLESYFSIAAKTRVLT